jgi:uncharacterized protein YecT (DUF1311 family)
MRPLLITLTALIGLSAPCSSQTRIKESDLKKVETDYKLCLDEGAFMLGCSKEFYKDLDSCLNVVYKQLKEKLDASSKAALKKEQLGWLKTRDLKFQQIDRTNKEEGQDGKMFRQDEKAAFVRDRVLILIKRLNKKHDT